MTGQQFSKTLAANSAAAERAHLAKLVAAYEIALRATGHEAARTFTTLTAAAWQPPPEGLVLTVAALKTISGRLNSALAPIWKRVLADVAVEPLARIGIAWDVSHPLAAGLLDSAAQRTSARIEAAAQLEIRKTIGEAYTQGLSVRDTAKLISTSVADAAPWQADMLARSDLNSLANGSSLAAAKLAEVGFKTWDCVVGETEVLAFGVTHAARRIHTGTFVELATVAGRIVTVTGEHPILTRRGWMPAEFVHEGDDLIGYAPSVEGRSPGSGVVPDPEHMPPEIAEAFGALTQVRPLLRIMGVVPDLDVEGHDREVDVVAVDGELTDRFEPAIPESLREVGLVLTDVSLSALLADRSSSQREVVHALAGRRLPRGFDPFLDDLCRLAVSSEDAGGRLRAEGNIALRENPGDDLGRAAHGAGYSGDREAADVLFDYDRCVSVNITTASRHVYDYTTRGGWMIANGLIVHNSTLDAVTRPTHAEAHGQTVPIDGVFNVGGEDCSYPGDPVLSDAEACGCRCTVIYGDTLNEAQSLLAAGGAMMTNMIKRAIKQAQADASKNSRNALVAAASPIPFEGTAAIEGQISDDNSLTPRVLLPDALSWPEMPVPFMAQTVTAEGHDGAEVAGRIDSFGRKRGTGRMRSITTAGELTTPFGVDEVAPMIADKTLRYVSVDLGSSEWAIVNRSTFKEISESDLSQDDLMAGVYALGLTSAKIKALTLVPTQAIEGASVALTASADGKDATLTMPLDFVLGDMDALVASAAPVAPPAAWFQTPEPPGEMPLTITKDGRVYGHLAIWSSCHVGFLPGQCVPPPRSPSNYARFHTAELDSAEGTAVWAGKLMFSPSDGGHADRSLSPSKASAYYDRTGMAAAYLRAVDGAHGIWVAGALNPKLSDEQRVEMRRELRLNPPSGDWRVFDGQHDLICGLAVAVPGFPVSRAGAEITVVASAEGAVLDLNDAIIASSGFFDADPAALDALEHEGLLDGEAEAERRMRVLAARAGGLDALAELAG